MSDTPETETPRADAIAHHGYGAAVYIVSMTALARELEAENARLRGKIEGLRRVGKADPFK